MREGISSHQASRREEQVVGETVVACGAGGSRHRGERAMAAAHVRARARHVLRLLGRRWQGSGSWTERAGVCGQSEAAGGWRPAQPDATARDPSQDQDSGQILLNEVCAGGVTVQL
jgi:hypothetical protein